MRSILYFLALVCLFSFGKTKVTIQNLTLKDPKTQVILANIQNKIKISGITEFELTSKYCYVNPNAEDKTIFSLRPKLFTNKKDTLKIIVAGRTVARFEYRIDSLPRIEFGIKDISSGSEVTVAQLKKNHELEVSQEKSAYCDCAYEVKSYEVVYITTHATKRMPVHGKGEAEQAWKTLDGLTTGSIVRINSIILRSEKCGNTNYPSLSYTIK